MNKNWKVVVTYGNIRNQVYAAVPTEDSALKLKDAAIRLGYRDARVMEEAEYAKLVNPWQKTARRGEARPPAACCSSR